MRTLRLGGLGGVSRELGSATKRRGIAKLGGELSLTFPPLQTILMYYIGFFFNGFVLSECCRSFTKRHRLIAPLRSSTPLPSHPPIQGHAAAWH